MLASGKDRERKGDPPLEKENRPPISLMEKREEAVPHCHQEGDGRNGKMRTTLSMKEQEKGKNGRSIDEKAGAKG